MARAIAKCTCSICGAKFEKIAFKNNRAEAESFVAWAVENITTCPDCYKAEQQKKTAAQAAEIKAELSLPEISAVSAKQLAFAESLRDRHLVENAATMRYAAKMLRRIERNIAKFEAAAAAEGKTTEAFIEQAIATTAYATEAMLLKCSSAAKIIDALK